MKAPKYEILSTQQAIDAGLNGFALILMAESFADDPNKFGDENVLLLARGHNGQEVWFVMTKTQPVMSDFEPVAVVPSVVDHGPYCERCTKVGSDEHGADQIVFCGYMKDHNGPCDFVRAV